MHIHAYIENLDKEIDTLIENESKKLTMEGEKTLNVLMSNCKYAHWYMENKKMLQHDTPMMTRKNPY